MGRIIRKQKNERVKLLSYGIDGNTPLYPGTLPLKLLKEKDTRKGDSCNTFMITISNHSGTHIDGPGHFFPQKKSRHARLPALCVYNDPVILDCRPKPESLIKPADLSNIQKASRKADAVLIRTGFSRHRNDHRIYAFRNPCLAPESALLLRNTFPRLRLIGIDTLSVSSISHRDEGRQTHRILLGKNGPKRGIFIIEDMFIPNDIASLKKIYVMPLVRGDLDSAPCAVLGFV